MIKLWKIFSFEFNYQVRSLATWLYLVVLVGFVLLMDQLTSPGDGVYANNTFHITAVTVIGGFIWLVMCPTIAGDAAARDIQMRMFPLTYTSPITKLDYLGGRFLAALAVNALLILALPVSAFVSFHFTAEEETLLPFTPLPYLNVYFLITVPMVFVATTLQFTFSALSRNVMTSYIATLLLAILSQVLAIAIGNLSGNWNLVKLLDPVGMTGIIGTELQTWSPAEKNTRLVVLEGMFLWNRILWIGGAAGLLALTYFRYNFANQVAGKWSILHRARRKNPANAGPENTRSAAIVVQPVERNFNFETYFRQARCIGWIAFVKMVRHPAGLIPLAIVLIAVFFSDTILTKSGIPLSPTTSQVLEYLATPINNISTPWVSLPLLIMYFGGVLVWRERDAGISDLADATPISEWALLTGKFFGIALMIFTWMAMLMTGGMLMQVKLGYSNFEMNLYAKALLGLQFIEYLLFALLTVVVHIVVNQKYPGYLVMLLVFFFIAFPAQFGVQHHLLIFGSHPGWSYTEMRGFGDTPGPWLWFKGYWIAWLILMAVVARLLWVRGRAQSLRDRLRLVPRRFTRATRWVALVAAILIAAVGSVIFYNTNVINEYATSSDLVAQRGEYERRYARYRNTPQPTLTATKLFIEIYPERRKAEIRATYTLVNTATVPIDTVHFGGGSVLPAAVTFNRTATAVIIDHELNHHIYHLEKPLQPGDSLQLNVDVRYQQKGFTNSKPDAPVVENGTYFTNFDLLPTIGYQDLREIDDAVLRRKHHLPPRPALPLLDDIEARKKSLTADNTTFEAVIGTTVDEVAVAPGALQRTWTEGDRRYFHYKTDGPIGAEYAILSAEYAVRESRWKDVAINHYYHPGHNQNTDRMQRSVTASLDYFTAHFGPYPYKHLTLVERAGPGGGATADASIVYYGEQYALMIPDDSPDGFDLPHYILSHEIAHQWWGLARLTPAYVEGAGVLIEGLAVYSGMQVLEATHGAAHSRKYVNYLHSFYEMPRALASAPLLRANEDFLYYRKGGLALYALSRYIGIANLNTALRELLTKRTAGTLPHPTTLDLYREIQTVTPDSLNYLLRDLFVKNTYWRLKTTQATAKPTAQGLWDVTLKIHAQKVVVDSTGTEQEIPMNDWLEVGLYAADNSTAEPLHLKMHRIHSGEQTILITVPRKPTSAGLDPNHLMIDVRRDDNVVEVE